jgi:hypothetical protein
VNVSANGSSPCPPLESSWQRSERACAARQRGDVYYELNETPARPPSASQASDAANLSGGFTLHL